MIELIRADRLPSAAEPIVKPMNWGWAINRGDADSGWKGDQFSGDEVAGQPVAGRVDCWDWEAVCRLGIGVPVTRQRWTAAAESES